MLAHLRPRAAWAFPVLAAFFILMPLARDSQGTLVWQGPDGTFRYDDGGGNFVLTADQFYPPPPASPAELIAKLANPPVEGGIYPIIGDNWGSTAVYKGGAFYDPHGLLVDITGGVVRKIGDYANTGITTGFTDPAIASQMGGGDYVGPGPGGIIDFRTPAQRAEDQRKYLQASAPSGFDKLMEAATVATLAAIGGAAAASAIGGGAGVAGDVGASSTGEGATGVITPAGEAVDVPLAPGDFSAAVTESGGSSIGSSITAGISKVQTAIATALTGAAAKTILPVPKPAARPAVSTPTPTAPAAAPSGLGLVAAALLALKFL